MNDPVHGGISKGANLARRLRRLGATSVESHRRRNAVDLVIAAEDSHLYVEASRTNSTNRAGRPDRRPRRLRRGRVGRQGGRGRSGRACTTDDGDGHAERAQPHERQLVARDRRQEVLRVPVGRRWPVRDQGLGASPEQLALAIAGLTPDTLYCYVVQTVDTFGIAGPSSSPSCVRDHFRGGDPAAAAGHGDRERALREPESRSIGARPPRRPSTTSTNRPARPDRMH